MLLGQNRGQELTKSEIICLFVIILVFLKKIFGGMGSPANHVLIIFFQFSQNSLRFKQILWILDWKT